MQELLKHFRELSLHPKNAKRLKILILDLAISGQLTREYRAKVPQDTINDLCKGKFNIPTGWYWNTFQNGCDFKMGKTPPSKQMQFWEGEIPWVSIADMPKRGIIRKTKKKITDLALINHFKGQKVEKGTLLMSFKLSIGKTAILDMDSCHNEAIISIYPKDFIDQKFLYYFLPLISNWGTQVSAIKGNTLNKSKIQNLKVPIPSLEEQQEIIRIVETLFKEVEDLENLTEKRIQLKMDYATSALNKLAKNDSKIEWQVIKPQFHSFFNEVDNIKKLREAILQLAVQGKLTAKWRAQNPELISGENSAENLLKKIKAEKAKLVKEKKIKKEKALPPITEDEIPYELPEGWVWCHFQSLFQDLTYGTSKKCDYGLGDTPVLRIPNLVNGEIDLNDLKSTDLSEKEIDKLSLEENDLLIIRSNGSVNLVGKSSIIDKKAVGFSYAGYLIRIRPFKNYLNSYFLHLVLESPFIRESIEIPIRSTSGVKNINTTEVSQLHFSLPPLEEQKEIVEKVNSLMTLCDQLEKEVETSHQQIEDLMQSVLKEVFEGEKELENA